MGRKSVATKQRIAALVHARTATKRRREESREGPHANNNVTSEKENIPPSSSKSNEFSTLLQIDDSHRIQLERATSSYRPTTTDAATSTDPIPEQIKVVLVQSSSLPSSDKETQSNPLVPRKLRKPDSEITESNIPNGRRIVSFASMNNAITDISFHSSMCGKSPVHFLKETKRGLQVKSIFVCGCGKQFIITADADNHSLQINEALVWGSTQSAVGFTAVTSLLTTLEVPSPSFGLYKKYQDTAHVELVNGMHEDMLYWAKQEAEMALAAGEFVIIHGKKYAAITVILDGGWSKRSYRHSFSANCGIAVIIGARSGKVIYANTKISTCSVCETKNKGRSNKPHDCYKNWNGAPNGMECQLILEGFKRSMAEQGLVYWKFVGDGDSSVYNSVIDVYPTIKVEKIECKNHVCRNFTTKLMDISLNSIKGKNAPNISLEEKRIFNPTIPRFKAGLTQAINYHHKEGSDWKELRQDILNMPYHIFGNHSKCKSYFCNGAKTGERNIVPMISKMNLWRAIENALERPASLSPSLVKKQTSNYAESFMGVCAKYLEGKRKNFGQRYLYRLRMAASVFSFNENPFWASRAFEILKKRDPSPLWSLRSNRFSKMKNRKRTYRVRRPLKIKKLAPPNLDYGDNPDRPDLDDDILQLKIEEMRLSLQADATRVKEIEERTREQSKSETWIAERFGRVTASKAGPIFRLRDKTDNTSVLNAYFGKKLFSTVIKAMKYGQDHEDTAIAEYERVNNLPPGYVKKSGLFVYEKNGLFGASPDGLVGNDGILEVKCPYSLHTKDQKRKGPQAWPELSKSSSLRRNKDGTLQLKKTHDHYYQIIMQLYVTNRSWCDYFVWSEHGHYCERIVRNSETDKLWAKMMAKLERFWLHDLAPEIVDSRMDRGWSHYRCPSYRLEEREKKLKAIKLKVNDLNA